MKNQIVFLLGLFYFLVGVPYILGAPSCGKFANLNSTYSHPCTNGLQAPRIQIFNADAYGYLAISPSSLQAKWQSNSLVFIDLPYDTAMEVEITYGISQDCVNVSTVPHYDTFNIELAKCPYSLANVTINSTIYSSAVIGSASFSFPGVSTNQIPAGEYSFTAYDFNGAPCSSSINIGSKAGSLPQLSIQSAECNIPGSITVLNYQSYSSLSLAGTSDSSTPQGQVNGVFDNLSPSDYILTAVSNNCGTQTIPITIQSSTPQLKVTANENMVCITNTNYTVQLVEPSPLDPNPKFGVTFNYGIDVQYSGSGCSIDYSLGYQYDPYNFNYTIDYSSVCFFKNNSALVTINGIENVNNLVVNGPNYSPIELYNNNTQFWALIDEFYSVTSDCNTFNFNINPTLPKPFIVETPLSDLEKDQTSCLWNTTLSVVNYLYFSNLTLSSTSSNLVFDGVDGVFENIPRIEYSLSYTYLSDDGSSCYTSTMDIDLALNTPGTENFTLEWLGYDGTCSNSVVSFQVTLANGQVVTNNDVEYNENDVYYVASSSYCTFFIFWMDHPPAYLPSEATTITASDFVCQYSPSISITASGYESVESVYIDGVLQSTNNNLVVPSGTYNVTVLSSNYRYESVTCVKSANVTVQDLDKTNFAISCVPTHVTQCNTGGSINCILPPSTTITPQFTANSVGLGTQEVLFNYLPPGLYTISVVSSACSSGNDFLTIEVLDQTNMNITHQIRRPQTCSEGDGIIGFSLVDPQTSMVSPIESIVYQGQSYYKSYLDNVNSDDLEFTLISQFCIISYNISQLDQISGPLFDFSLTPSTSCSTSPTVSMNVLSPYVTPGYIQNGGCTYSYLENIFYDCNNGNNQVTVTWNNYCQQIFNLPEITNYQPIVPVYEAVPPSTCSGLDSYLKIKNYNQFRYVISNYGSADSNGTIQISPTENTVTLQYEDINGCDGSIDLEMSFTNNITTPGIIIQPETCQGSFDGHVKVPTDKGKRYQLILGSNGIAENTGISYFYSIGQTDGLFDQLGAGEYLLIESDIIDYHCQAYKYFRIQSSEPELFLSPSAQCTTGDVTAPESINLGLQSTAVPDSTAFNNVSITLTGPSGSQQYLPSDLISSLTSGQSYDVELNVTDKRCRRIVKGNMVQNETATTVNLNVYGNDTLTDLSKPVACAKESTSTTSKKSLAWVVAPIIGALLVIFLIAFLIYRKKKKPIEKQVKEDKIEMNTVPIYLGGKIDKIDDF